MNDKIKQDNYTYNLFDKIRIVMVNTTQAGNIGAAARAMKNMSLSRLYLVNPNNFPSSKATSRASGADDVLSNAVVCNSLEDALKGSHLVVGVSARQRTIKWNQLDVVKSCGEINKTIVNNNQEVAVVFGTESSGLSNKELDLCHILMTIPGNKEYKSLNVASAIQVFSYQYFVLNSELSFDKGLSELASFDELDGFYKHLEQILQHIEYFEEKRPKEILMRRLRRLFHRSTLEKEEVAILRGILHNIKPFNNKD